MDQICPTRVFPVKNGRSEHRHWMCILELVYVLNFSLNWQFQILGPNLLSKYTVYIFGICCISFTNNRSNIFTENPKTLEILPFHQLYTKAWPKMRNLRVNPKKCERRKKAIPMRFTKVNVIKSFIFLKRKWKFYLFKRE